MKLSKTGKERKEKGRKKGEILESEFMREERETNLEYRREVNKTNKNRK